MHTPSRNLAVSNQPEPVTSMPPSRPMPGLWQTGASTTPGRVSDERELHLAWERHVGASADADAWFDTVVGLHRAPTRHYHGLRHVTWVVRHAHDIAAATPRPLTDDGLDRVIAAAFFHDAVYDATRSDNEVASSRLAARALGEIGWAAETVQRVGAMIVATAEHDVGAATDAPTQVLIAADLAVLAAEPAKYDDYTRAVRRDYAHLDDAAWRAGRSAFLRATLERDHIFPPTLDLDDWERRARANLSAELAALP
jgi:predicted metal-dependent HD superfamily phosphohydrolase